MIAVMGATGTGKSTFINTASGSSLRVGEGLESCTAEIETASPFYLDGRSVTLIDTPGFDDTVKKDSDILELITEYLASSYREGQKLTGVIYMHRISDFRMGGISTRNFAMFTRLCGEKSLKNVVILTNMWSEVTYQEGEQRERELASSPKFFKPALDREARMLRHQSTVESAHDILRSMIDNDPMALRIQEEIVDENLDMYHTGAGEELNREWIEEEIRHREALGEVEDYNQERLRELEEEARRQWEYERQMREQEILEAQREQERLEEEYQQEQERRRWQWEEEQRRREYEAQMERERYLRRLHEQEMVMERQRIAAEREQERLRAEAQRRRQQAHDSDGSSDCVVM